MAEAAYDGWAEWYEQYLQAPAYAVVEQTLYELLGEGRGRCLDYGCGIGHLLPGVAKLGWDEFGFDLSSDMISRACSRSDRVARADAARFPFADASFNAVVTCLTHTDVDDVAPVFAEVARVLHPGARFVTVAVHPCFAGATARMTEDGGITVAPGYHDISRRFVGQGVRARVGVRHVPLAELLTKLAHAGFRIDRVVETGPPGVTPIWLGLSATRL
jgi:ubiquinone/menaquinone biosynthesis C-methylase UbiE